jgi:hypothetical protein
VKPSYRYNQDWYTIKYGLAALHANEWVRRLDVTGRRRQRAGAFATGEEYEYLQRELNASIVEPPRAAAFATATGLAVAAFETLDALEGSRIRLRRQISKRRSAVLRDYLRDALLPATMVLLAGVTPRPDGRAEASAFVVIAGDRRRQLDGLRRAIGSKRADRDQLIAYVAALDRRDPRVDYNLACLYAFDSQEQLALDKLAESIRATPVGRRNGVAQRAVKDPVLTDIITNIGAGGNAEALRTWAEGGAHGANDDDPEAPRRPRRRRARRTGF